MKKLLYVAVALMVAGSIAGTTQANAATMPQGLGISPTRQELSITAGTSYSGKVSVSNQTSQPLLVDMYAETFTVANESYDYTFLDDSSLNQWVRFSQPSFTLQPHTNQTIGYTIGVPTTATPGGKYFSLFAATSSQATQRAIAISERVGSLLYITVPGNVSHTGKLLGLDIPTVAFSAIHWSEKVDNTGANYFHSAYTVSLKNVWGKVVSQNQGSALIISSSVRLVTGQLNTPTWLGLYKVTAQFSLGDNGTQVDSRWLLYLPLPQVLTLIAILVVVIILISRRRRKKKTA